MKCTVKHLPTDWLCPKCNGSNLLVQEIDHDSFENCDVHINLPNLVHPNDELSCEDCNWSGYGSDIENDDAAQDEDLQWYIRDEDGKIFGPFDSEESATFADRLDNGLIFSSAIFSPPPE